MRYKKELTAKEKELICSLYVAGKPSCKLSQKFDCSRAMISSILAENGIPIKSKGYARRKIKQFNESFFSVIDTEAKAYFLGLMFADGNVSKKRTTVRLELTETDKHILSTLSYLIYNVERLYFVENKKYAYRAKNASNTYKIEVNSQTMKNDLIRHGCMPDKSLILQSPDIKDKELMRHFIRGYFDGDGSISSTPNRGKNGTNDYILTITTTESMCKTIQCFVLDEVGISLSILSANVSNGNNTTKTLHSGGNRKILALFEWLYKDATCYLARKYAKFLALKNQCQLLDNNAKAL